MRYTNSGKPQDNEDDASVPTFKKHPDGQYEDHWVLSPEDRAKGFVRPMRLSYRHVGTGGPVNPMRDLTAEERVGYDRFDYVKYEQYPKGDSIVGRFWTQKDLDGIGKGCGSVTSMPKAIAETYAVDPHYYGRTFCCSCGDYFPVGPHGEFVWTGTNERVGT